MELQQRLAFFSGGWGTPNIPPRLRLLYTGRQRRGLKKPIGMEAARQPRSCRPSFRQKGAPPAKKAAPGTGGGRGGESGVPRPPPPRFRSRSAAAPRASAGSSARPLPAPPRQPPPPPPRARETEPNHAPFRAQKGTQQKRGCSRPFPPSPRPRPGGKPYARFSPLRTECLRQPGGQRGGSAHN